MCNIKIKETRIKQNSQNHVRDFIMIYYLIRQYLLHQRDLIAERRAKRDKIKNSNRQIHK